MTCPAIFHSVNSSLFFWHDFFGLLIDGIFRDDLEGFSPMPPLQRAQLATHTGLFAHVNAAAFTHLHPDHFDPEGVVQLLNAPRAPLVYAPGFAGGNIAAHPLGGGVGRVDLGPVTLYTLDTVHDGKTLRDTPHQSLLLHWGEVAFFIAGDATFQAAEADPLLAQCRAPVAAGFFNVYQLASPDSRGFIRALAPKRVFLYHLPRRKDDSLNFWRLADRVAPRPIEGLPPVEVLEHMAWIEGFGEDTPNLNI